ncbi:MAG: carbohydrate ABC transporter permease [Candidatus Goldiibacteriota bacterium]
MKEEQLQKIITAAGYIGAVIFCLAPFIYMLIISFSGDPDFLAQGRKISFTLQHYSDVIAGRNLHFLDYLKNSIIVSSAASVITVIIASLGAFAVTRMEFKGKITVLLAVLCMSMFPQISIAGYIFKIMSSAGLINTKTGLIMPYVAWALPLSLWILTGYFASLPKSLDDAAYIDGAGPFQVFWRIILPVAAPGIASTLLLAFIFSFNEFLFALMLTTDHTARTVPVGIALFTGLHGQTPWGQIMAASAVTTAPIIIMTVVFQKKIVQGLTKGAVKE